MSLTEEDKLVLAEIDRLSEKMDKTCKAMTEAACNFDDYTEEEHDRLGKEFQDAMNALMAAYNKEHKKQMGKTNEN